MTPAEKAARMVEHVAQHNERHGYSQAERYGTGWTETIDLGDGEPVTIHDQYDCSALAINSYACQGIDTGGATYTLDMYKLLDSGNFVDVPIENRKRGDILNSTTRRHAAMYLGNNILGEAIHGDSADRLGGRVGDQDGTEIRITDYYDGHWTSCYRCTVPVKNGWVKDNDGNWYFYVDNETVKNDWCKDPSDGEWYYFNAQGVMLRNSWVTSDNDDVWYYVKGNGVMARSEPIQWNDGWCWADSMGEVKKNATLTVEDWHIK